MHLRQLKRCQLRQKKKKKMAHIPEHYKSASWMYRDKRKKVWREITDSVSGWVLSSVRGWAKHTGTFPQIWLVHLSLASLQLTSVQWLFGANENSIVIKLMWQTWGKHLRYCLSKQTLTGETLWGLINPKHNECQNVIILCCVTFIKWVPPVCGKELTFQYINQKMVDT